MKVVNLKTNHMTNPLGFDLGTPTLSYQIVDCHSLYQVKARIEVSLDESFSSLLFDSGADENINHIGFELPIELQPITRYFWRVSVWGNENEYATSEVSWFETAKLNRPWQAVWIKNSNQGDYTPIFCKQITLQNKPISSARAYVCGLGLYELYINNVKAGDEYLSPGCHAYDSWQQYQTYDITDTLTTTQNSIQVLMGDGWYQGRFVFKTADTKNHYGTHYQLIAEFVIHYKDGSCDTFLTDASWLTKESIIKANSIYDGEIIDANHESALQPCQVCDEQDISRLTARLSLPVQINERIKPVETFLNSKGQLIIDFGQNLVG